MARKAQNQEAIRRIQEAIDNKLTELDLSRLYLRRLPSALYEATNLKRLDISHNKLTRLSSKFSKLRELNTLYVYNNWFESIPDSVFKLTKLEVLSFALNKLEELPTNIQELKHLNYLYLNSNCIEVLDLNTIIKLNARGLKHIDLRDNLILNAPEIANYGLKEIVEYYNHTPLLQRKTLLYETKYAIESFINERNYITKKNIEFKVEKCAKMIERYYQKKFGISLTDAYSQLIVFFVLGYDKTKQLEYITSTTFLCKQNKSTISRLKAQIEKALNKNVEDIYSFFKNQIDSIIKNE